MSEPQTPALLSDERLAEIAALQQQWNCTLRGLHANPNLAANYASELLADRAALQAFFDARDKELCQTHDEFRQQVAQQLRGLLQWVEPSGEHDENTWHKVANDYDNRISAAAQALHIDLA